MSVVFLQEEHHHGWCHLIDSGVTLEGAPFSGDVFLRDVPYHDWCYFQWSCLITGREISFYEMFPF